MSDSSYVQILSQRQSAALIDAPHFLIYRTLLYICFFVCLHAVCVCALDSDLCLIFLFQSRQRSKGLFVMRRNMAARTIFKIITTSCSFSHSICLRIGCLCVCMNLCVRGFSGSGFCRWWGSRRLQFVCSHYPLGLGCVCVGVCLRLSQSVWEDVISQWQSTITAD